MSKIKKEIERLMDEPTTTDSGASSTFRFPPDFVGFQGHFPTGKVLPGACQIQCVISTIEKSLMKHVVLKQIVLGKFFAPVFPDEKIICTVSGLDDNAAEFICKSRISRGEEKIADIRLQICTGEII